METKLNTDMNIETPVFKKLKKYLQDKSKFKPYVFNDIPKNLTVFPTITFIENTNIEDTRATTLNRQEYANRLTVTVEIYAKDTVIDGIQYSSKEIINELKYLIFDFFQAWGFTRTQATKADYLNYEVGRYVIIETCIVNNWNRKINL